MVRDEQDVVGATVAHMLDQCDHVIVADNRSIDRTRPILDDLARTGPLTVIDDPVIGYYQADKMTHLANVARAEFDAEWVVPFDADEWWTSPKGRIADVLGRLDPALMIAEATLYDHVPTDTDDPRLSPFERMRWRHREPGGLPKVAARTAPDLQIHMGNHGANYSQPVDTIGGLLVVHHFPYRSAEQFVSKARNGAEAYAATDLPDHFGTHWRDYGRLLDNGGPKVLHEVFEEFFYFEDPASNPDLVEDPVSA